MIKNLRYIGLLFIVLSLLAKTTLSNVYEEQIAFWRIEEGKWVPFIIGYTSDISESSAKRSSRIHKGNHLTIRPATDETAKGANATQYFISYSDTPHNDTNACPTSHSIGPDGTVIFAHSLANSKDAHDIWLCNTETGEIQQLTRMPRMQHDPVWCSENDIVFVSSTSDQSHDLWRLELDTKSTYQITAGQLYNFEPSCHNDEIVFSSNRSGDYEIWRTDLDGTFYEQLTDSPGLDAQPSWAPDMQHIVFISSRSGYRALWIMDRDGKNQRQISPEGMICRDPVWTN